MICAILFIERMCIIMKKLIKGFFLFLILSVCSIQTVSAAPVSVTLNGKLLSFDTAPYLENGRVLVPVRGILESLGYTIQWQEETQTVLATKDGLEISLPLNSNTVTVNNESVTIDVPAAIKGSRTFVPLRFLAEYSGADVHWDAVSSTVVVYSSDAVSYNAADSVVYIQTDKRQGSGVILTSNGLIVTNYHIVKDASAIQIIFNDGQFYQGATNVVGVDPQNDISLLKIEKYDLTPAFISTEYSVGDPVTAIGSPKGVRNVSTTGMIEGFDQDVIVSTAPITNGNSGGGLFDASNKLIGIPSFFGDDKYFAIPVSLVQQVQPVAPFPLYEMENYPYIPDAPENLRCTNNGKYAYISWSPVYNATHYCIYTAYAENGTYTRLNNTITKDNVWSWGFPHAFGISINPDKPYYLKISAVVDGVETPLSAPLKISK